MISASDIEETQEVLIKTDVVEIKSEAEEAGGNVTSENSIPNLNLEENPIETVQDRLDMVQIPDMGQTRIVEIKSEAEEAGRNWQENVRIQNVRSENSIPNSNLVGNPIEMVQNRPDMGQRPGMGHGPDMVNQAICKHCGATFTDPYGMAQLSHHLMTFHFNHNPEIHMVSTHSIIPTPTSTFVPTRSEMVPRPEMVHRPEMGQRPFVSQPPLPHSVTPNDIMREYMLRQQERERIRFLQTGAQQVNEEPK